MRKSLQKGIEPQLIFEDSQILVIEKASGVVVNRAKTVRGKTIQDWIERNYPIIQLSNYPIEDKEFYRRSGIVHRLDKETSGLLLIAKTPQAFGDLQSQFKKRKVKKRYLALVHGEMKAREGEIRLPIKRLPWNREKFGIMPEGRSAKTGYKLLSCYTLPALPAGRHVTCYSFLEVEPETGRTHQIRVHFKHLGHPLVGDLKYGGRRGKKERKWCPRLFLHASYLAFAHPKTGKRITLKSPLPKDLEGVLSTLNKT